MRNTRILCSRSGLRCVALNGARGQIAMEFSTWLATGCSARDHERIPMPHCSHRGQKRAELCKGLILLLYGDLLGC